MNKNKQLNILLVVPRISYAWADWPVPPIGTAYISSYLKHKGCKVYVANLNLESEPVYEVLEKEIYKNDIDIIGCGDLVVNYLQVKEVIDNAKSIKPDILTIIGGGLVTHSPVEAMQIIDTADYGIIGEGEISTYKLILSLETNQPPEVDSISGLIYRKDVELIITKLSKDDVNINGIPWPDYEGVQLFEMMDEMCFNKNDRSAIVTTSRSCPFSCTFCSKSGGGSYRQRSLKLVFEEISYLIKEKKVKKLFLNDELFANDKDRVESFCKGIKKFDVEWIVFLRVSKFITTDLLSRMKNSGCVEIFYGIESADNSILRSMRKGITKELIEKTLKLTKSSGIRCQGGFIFGDVAETIETAKNTITWAEEHIDLFDRTRFSPIICYPGSKLYDIACEKGVIADKIRHIEKECPCVNVSAMPDEQYNHFINKVIPYYNQKFDDKLSDTNVNRDVKVLEGDGQNYKFIVKCQHCKNIYIMLIAPKLIKYQDYFSKCTVCNEINVIKPLPSYIEYIKERIYNEIQSSDEKLVFWGYGYIFKQILESCDFLKNKLSLIVVDNNESKQGIDGNVHVIDPSQMHEYKIKKIIICAPLSVDAIENYLRKYFKGMYKIIDIMKLGL